MAGTVWNAVTADIEDKNGNLILRNPIEWVKVDLADAPMYIKTPSAYDFEIDDISKPDAGRTANGTMVKSQLYVNGKPKRAFAISMEWQYLSSADIAGLLSVFQAAEYLHVRYFNPVSDSYYTAQFYVGNRTMPMYNKTMGIWTTLSLKLISRN